MSFKLAIHKALAKFGSNGTTVPDTSNTGKLVGEAYMWDEIASYAKKKSEQLWGRLEADGIIEPPDNTTASESVLYKSKSFIVNAKVSNPVKRFNPSVLAKALNKKYKVPIPVAIQMIEEAKIGTKGTVTLSIVELTQ